FVSPSLKSLPQDFTAEFDLLLDYNTGEEGYPLPNVQIRLLELLKADATARAFLNKGETLSDVVVELSPAGEETSMIEYRSSLSGREHLSNDPKTLRKLDSYFGKPMHLAIWVQGERFRLWINGEKVYDIPNAVPVKAAFNRLSFSTESSMYTGQQVGMYVSNIKIAEGAPDLRNKLITEGKLETTGILFDVASDRIMPGSYSVLKEIAQVLKDNPSVKVKITGHTDSDGDTGQNLDLSKRRAVSVKKALSSEFKIEADRMQTDGAGATKPVADNSTREGKFRNRRVEFTRL
ncbi:MAG TPA: OmpA family protein, partial [Chitinophagaceae bacterium]